MVSILHGKTLIFELKNVSLFTCTPMITGANNEEHGYLR